MAITTYDQLLWVGLEFATHESVTRRSATDAMAALYKLKLLNESEVWLGWWCYLDDKLAFPFQAGLKGARHERYSGPL
jgi:hypothetical protein